MFYFAVVPFHVILKYYSPCDLKVLFSYIKVTFLNTRVMKKAKTL